MGDILDAESVSLRIEIYSSYKTVKYHLRTSGKSATEFLKRPDFRYSPVDSNLCNNMRSARSAYKNKLKRGRLRELPVKKVVFKAQDKTVMRENAAELHMCNEKKGRSSVPNAIESTLYISNSDISNSAKLEASV